MAKVACKSCNHPPYFFPLEDGVCIVCRNIEGLKKENAKMKRLLDDVTNSPVAQAERILAGKEANV